MAITKTPLNPTQSPMQRATGNTQSAKPNSNTTSAKATNMSNTNTKTSVAANTIKASAAGKSNESAVKTGTMKPIPSTAPTTNKTMPQTKASGKTAVKAEFAQDMTKMDDVAIISDILASQKGLVTRYGTALTEISCEKLRKLVSSQLTEAATDQYDAFLYMNQRNQYPTENAQSEKVKQAKQKYACAKEKMKK